jgi:hypothetical protein
MDNKGYVSLLDKYKKALASAGKDVIAPGDKSKLASLLNDTYLTLKDYGDESKLVDVHNAIYDDYDKLAAKIKKYNADVKTRNAYFAAAAQYANSAKSIAGQQKGFDKVKDLKGMADDMVNVANWLDIIKRKELKDGGLSE